MADSGKVISKVAEKQSNGSLGDDYSFQVAAKNVVSNDGYTAEELFKNYLAFMQESSFMIYSEIEPVNNHAVLWIDTSQQ